MMLRAAIVGWAIGSATNKKIFHSLAQSSRAASNNSSGIIMKACRMRSTPSEVNSGGTISANHVFANPKSLATITN